ncbi:hypothetical protein PV406_41775, partial [Streptomyces scabiei]|nr:hypothetical protein [Streptomyces scabiei]
WANARPPPAAPAADTASPSWSKSAMGTGSWSRANARPPPAAPADTATPAKPAKPGLCVPLVGLCVDEALGG